MSKTPTTTTASKCSTFKVTKVSGIRRAPAYRSDIDMPQQIVAAYQRHMTNLFELNTEDYNRTTASPAVHRQFMVMLIAEAGRYQQQQQQQLSQGAANAAADKPTRFDQAAQHRWERLLLLLADHELKRMFEGERKGVDKYQQCLCDISTFRLFAENAITAAIKDL